MSCSTGYWLLVQYMGLTVLYRIYCWCLAVVPSMWVGCWSVKIVVLKGAGEMAGRSN